MENASEYIFFLQIVLSSLTDWDGTKYCGTVTSNPSYIIDELRDHFGVVMDSIYSSEADSSFTCVRRARPSLNSLENDRDGGSNQANAKVFLSRVVWTTSFILSAWSGKLWWVSKDLVWISAWNRYLISNITALSSYLYIQHRITRTMAAIDQSHFSTLMWKYF